MKSSFVFCYILTLFRPWLQLKNTSVYLIAPGTDLLVCVPTEPPVRIVSPSQSQMELCQQMSERMVLSCEISRANASVRWYRNGLEVEENNNLILEVDGVYRRLIIPETTVSDSAEYVCDTVDDSVTFFVNIAGDVTNTSNLSAGETERFTL